MSAELDAVLEAYLRIDPTHTLDSLLLDLSRGHGSWWAHAAYEVATRGMNDERGMPVNSFEERRDAQRELLERIAPELGSAVVEDGAMVRHG